MHMEMFQLFISFRSNIQKRKFFLLVKRSFVSVYGCQLLLIILSSDLVAKEFFLAAFFFFSLNYFFSQPLLLRTTTTRRGQYTDYAL